MSRRHCRGGKHTHHEITQTTEHPITVAQHYATLYYIFPPYRNPQVQPPKRDDRYIGTTIIFTLCKLIYLIAPNLSFVQYADDTNMFSTGPSLSNIFQEFNDALALVNEWVKANKLVINISKSNYMIMCFPGKEFHGRSIKLPQQFMIFDF